MWLFILYWYVYHWFVFHDTSVMWYWLLWAVYTKLVIKFWCSVIIAIYGGTFMVYSAYCDTFIILSWTVMFAEKCYRWGFSILWLPLCTNGYLSLCICLIIVIHDCLLYFLYSRLMPLLPVNRSSHINTSSNPNHLSPHPYIILCSNRHPGGSLIQLQIRSLQSKVSQHTYIHIHIYTYIYIYIYIYIYTLTGHFIRHTCSIAW